MTAVRVAVVILILAALIIAPRWPGIRDTWREQRLRNALRPRPDLRLTAVEEQKLRSELEQAMRLGNDLCADPPCSFEENFQCPVHKLCAQESPAGVFTCTLRHGHAGPFHRNTTRNGTVAWMDEPPAFSDEWAAEMERRMKA